MTMQLDRLGVANYEIQVSGRTNFPESRWREAILYYLFGVWSNNDDVMYRPKMIFGNLTLRLDPENGEYYAYGGHAVYEGIPPLSSEDLVETSGKQAYVEIALIRFVKNDRIRQLRLRLPAVCDPKVHVATLVLWKKTKRGEYGCAGLGLPYAWGTIGPVWTREEFERT